MNVHRHWRKFVILMTVVLMMAPAAVVLSAPGGIPGPPPGKGEEETVTNNLSVPAIFVPNAADFSTLQCPLDGAVPPVGGDPIDGWEVPGSYYVQGVHSWQAECATAAAGTITAFADWGDNLEGAPLKANTPIRVEVGLIDESGAVMDGYDVIKLEPSKLDRDSAYGTEATLNGDVFEATLTTFTAGIRVYDSAATFSIQNEVTGEYIVGPTEMRAEINSTGRIVYGYNWGIGGKGVKSLPQAGSYVITFTSPNVTLSNADQGTDTVTLHLIVEPNKKGGGKGPNPKAATATGTCDQLELHDRDRNRDGSCLIP